MNASSSSISTATEHTETNVQQGAAQVDRGDTSIDCNDVQKLDMRRQRHQHTAATQQELDPDIRLQKYMTPAAGRFTHTRTPDVGIGILVFVPSYRACTEKSPEMIQYYGEYLGHGLNKTAFELHCPGERIHGKVIKVARANDVEPSVFTEASKFDLTTSILYNCTGVDSDGGRRFHCWITDRSIPLDEFCRYDGADKSRCSLAAFCCILRAAQHGLYLSDCNFFNFGIQFTENDTEQLVLMMLQSTSMPLDNLHGIWQNGYKASHRACARTGERMTTRRTIKHRSTHWRKEEESGYE